MNRNTSLAIVLVVSAFFAAAPLPAQTAQKPAKPSARPSQPSQPPAVPSGSPEQPATAANTAAHETLGILDEKARHALAVQVALDRAGFSPGQIDAATGMNTERAWRAFQEAKGLSASSLEDAGQSELGDAFVSPVTKYAISADDVAGPFAEQIPTDMMAKAKLPTLAYSSVLELLSERFHASPKLLQRLSPQAKFERDETILVPNVEPFVALGTKGARDLTSSSQRQGGSLADATPATATPEAAKSPDVNQAGAARSRPDQKNKPGATKTGQPAPKPVTVTVTDSTKTLQVQNAAGETIFHAPVTVGSTNDPLPVGEWKVNGVSMNPPFNYNPELFWDANAKHAKAKIAPGPNNPVGVVWIDLSKEHYGIHGTPEPGRIGYTESHGCIRLTNWDAMRLAALVAPGTKVILR